MAQPVSNPKIEELRLRLKTDPKSRIFYPLAEELRKVSQFTEAEQVLRTGLSTHSTYLSAWVSLGRVLRELGNNEEAVDSLTRALQLDPGNVVAARILADAYLALGEKVEAIKKYKLVHALLPSDEELEATIERLELELHPPAPVPVEAAEPVAIPEAAPEVPPEQPPAMDETPWATEPEPDIFAVAETEAAHEQTVEEATGDAEPMSAAHAESPFEEPVADFGYSADAFSIEQPETMHVESTPVSAELPAEVVSAYEPADVFAPAMDDTAPLHKEQVIEVGIASDMPFPITADLAPPAPDDFSKTITMADLYAKQGLIDEARDIYEDILARDPGNEGVRAKLDALTGEAQTLMSVPASEETEEPEGAQTGVSVLHAKVARLEGWLARVGRRESGGV
jgi:tetratricopeptide (TPR) repeat protein